MEGKSDGVRELFSCSVVRFSHGGLVQKGRSKKAVQMKNFFPIKYENTLTAAPTPKLSTINAPTNNAPTNNAPTNNAPTIFKSEGSKAQKFEI